MIIFLSLFLLSICQAQENTQLQVPLAEKTLSQLYLFNWFKVVNIYDLFAIIEKYQTSQTDQNQLQIRFAQTSHNKELHIKSINLNLQEVYNFAQHVDSGWRFNQILKYINDKQALILWMPIKRNILLEVDKQELQKIQSCLLSQILTDNLTFLELIQVQSTNQSIETDNCYNIHIFKASIIQANKFINIDFNNREITLQVYYNGYQSFSLGNQYYEYCQALLDSIAFDLLSYLGFQVLNINLSLTNLSESVNCTINRTIIRTRIYISEQFQEFRIPIQYTFLNFGVISIQHVVFYNQVIFLNAQQILLTNISIRDNNQLILMNCDSLTIKNILMSNTFSVIKIISNDIKMSIDNFKLIEMTIYNQQIIQLLCKNLTLNLSTLLIQNSVLELFSFISYSNAFSDISIYNFTIMNTTMKNSSSLFSYANKLQANQITIVDTNFGLIASLFHGLDLIIENTIFTRCYIELYTILYQADYLNLYNQSFSNCSFNNAFIVNTDVVFTLNYRQQDSANNLILNGLFFYETQGQNGASPLISVTVKQDASISNIFIYGNFSAQLFILKGNNININNIRVNHSNITLNSPLLNIIATNIFFQNMIFISTSISKNDILNINSDITYISDLWFIDSFYHQEQSVRFKFISLKLILRDILFESSRALLSANSLKIFDIKCDQVFIIHFSSSGNNFIQLFIKSQQILIDYMYVNIKDQFSMQLLIITSISLIIQNSRFQGVHKLLEVTDNSMFMHNSTAEFLNNTIYYNLSELTGRVFNVLEFIGIKYIQIINNNFQMMGSNNGILLNINQAFQTQITDNKIMKESQIIMIVQLNQISLSSMRNNSILSSSYNNAISIIEIINGQINVEYLFINSNSLHGLRFLYPIIVNLKQISAQGIQNLIDIYSQENVIIQFNNITINNITNQTTVGLTMPAIIIISGEGFSEIVIDGLRITGITTISSLYNFLQITTYIKSIELTNFILIRNEVLQSFLLIDDQSKNLSKLLISNMVSNNNYYKSLVESNLIIDIKDSLITLNTGSSIILSEQGIIQNCEIICEADLFQKTLNYQLINTSFTLNHYSVYKQIYLSFDYGLKFAVNQMIARNTYQVNFQNKKQYIYLPIGNNFNNFTILNFKTLEYRQQNQSLLFISNNINIKQCELTIFKGEQVYSTVHFNMNNNSLNNTILIMQPGTIVLFHTKCVDDQNDAISLQFMAKTMNCQIGEILVDYMCQICNPRIQQYSVQKNSIKCQSIDKTSMLSVDRGLIFLKNGFWRPFLSNNQVEVCQQNNNCIGGKVFGNKLCGVGYIGAICSECDLFKQINPDRYYKNQWQICNKCDIGLADILSQIISFIMTGALVCISVLSYRKLVLQNVLMRTISKIHQKIIRHQQDIVGVYISFLLDRQQVLFLMPFDLNIDFVTNTSFSFINVVDCSINQYFNSTYWIYIRIFFIFASYIQIFQIHVQLLVVYFIVTKNKYQHLLVTIALLKVYQSNTLGFFNQLLLLAFPIEFSGLQWIQGYKTLRYDSDLHYYMNSRLVLPILLVVLIILPIILYFKIKRSTSYYSSFTYFKYLYKESATQQDSIQRIFKFSLIGIIYYLQSQQVTRLIILTMTLYSQYIYQEANQPYVLQKLNLQYLQIQLWFDIQLIINGLIEQTYIFVLQYLLAMIFYVILILLITKLSINIVYQLLNDHHQLFDKLRLLLNSSLKTQLKLVQDRKNKVKNQYNMIRKYVVKHEQKPLHHPNQ